ncbi:MAG: methylamine utilization protein [Deltaproteobacteria bacterium]|nr:methylamine utilization protein [Deltaproteobacteria bacterium]MDQ3295148.1 methylamine utilization protein [Myxococcota bacterium]
MQQLIRAIIVLGVLGVVIQPADAGPAAGSVTGTVSVQVKGAAKPDRSGVVVYLEGVPGTPPKPKTAIIRQREKQFDPPLTIVVRGTTVDFPNDDKFFHNVFSVSRPARFDLGLYKSGAKKSVEMKRPGVVDVYCNIHPEMVAKVKVLDSAFYTITDRTGAFKIEGVPEGEYPIVAWLPSGDEARGKVKVTASKPAMIQLELAEVAKKASHLRKDGTPYGRYK